MTIILGEVGGPVTVELPELRALKADGLVLGRSPGSDPVDGGGCGWATVEYLSRPYLVRLAFEFARHYPEAGPVVLWPLGVAVELTAVACAVGGLLVGVRPVGLVAPVVCAVRPPMRRSRLARCHDVRADLDGCAVSLVVWELVVPARGVCLSGAMRAVAA
ncbi:hypothetical protein [Frankia nepalensis]|uniref:Uncharacterized protein n=1 Tax=Frankia nepalensis TaxID=1836974 RepID=A0A937UNU9_9ACTN|nr:hypothetical protein [Frankia nepalensis]MBL7498643.1 hypothetical protein [Frankia nepalensis]MBL7509191.1 hypothetical protein [Frankia nepalensis]MBL7628382.1 hypothetical protein [Frankia nepalensis]